MAEPGEIPLPKGIVLNLSTIYRELASYPVLPPEKIWECWRVYTTTHRRLSDPTALRLENFWWHVLGSDRRHLSGATLAKVFEDISEGPTVVPLRGPRDRYEVPSTPSPPAQPSSNAKRPPVRQNTEPGLQSHGLIRPTPPSATRPPPPHPILKKARGPSSSGPRPTARFAIPSASEDESASHDDEDRDGEAGLGSIEESPRNEPKHAKESSSSSSQEERRSAASSGSKKKKTHAIVVSNVTKRRPAMPRRQSSQSSVGGSGGSEISSREGSVPKANRHSGRPRSVSPLAENSHEEKAPGSHESGKRLSAKALGKRPAISPTFAKSGSSKPAASHDSSSRERPVVVQADTPGSRNQKSNVGLKGKQPVYVVDRNSEGTQKQADVHGRSPPARSPTKARSTPDRGTSRGKMRDRSAGGVPPQALISPSTAITSNVTAQGMIIDVDDNSAAQLATSAAASAPYEDSSTGLRRSGSSIVDSHFIPTQPTDTPPVPLGRTKSQLTLLLQQNDKKPRR